MKLWGIVLRKITFMRRTCAGAFFPSGRRPPGAGRFSLRTGRFPFGSDAFPSEPGASLPDPGTSPFPPSQTH